MNTAKWMAGAVAIGIAIGTAEAGTISGIITFDGKAPKAKSVRMSSDAFCHKEHPKGMESESVVVGKKGELKNVVVYLKSGVKGDFPAPKKPAVFDQKGCWYSPHVLAIQAGQPLMVRNSDSTLHNVHALPKANKGFNFAQPKAGLEKEIILDKAEVSIPVKCDVHNWMSARIAVIPHPFFAVSGEDGSFTIQDVPAGSYEMEAWHEVFGAMTQTVTVDKTGSIKASFTFKDKKGS